MADRNNTASSASPPSPVPLSAVETDPGVGLPLAFCATELPSGEANCFEPRRDSDPRLISSVSVLDIRPAQPEHVSLGAVTSTAYCADGSVRRGPEPVMIVQMPEDEVGVAIVTSKNGEPALVCSRAVSPALLARSARDLPILPGLAEGMLLELPSGYRTASALDAGALQVAQRRAGIAVDGDSTYPLGPAFFPASDICPALCLPMCTSAINVPQAAQVSFGEGFDGMHEVQVLTLQEIVDEFARGRLHDARLVETAFRLADERGLMLRLPRELQEKIVAECPHGAINSSLRILQGQDVKAILQGKQDLPGLVTFMGITPQALDQSDSAYLRAYALRVQNKGAQGSDIGNSYSAEAIVRKWDHMNVALVAMMAGKPYLAVNFSCREALEFRDQAPHVAHVSTSARSLEGVQAPITSNQLSDYYSPEQARRVIQSCLGIALECQPTVFPGFSVAAPDFLPNVSIQAIACVDAAKVSNAGSLAWIEPRVLIELAREGFVRDIALLQSARIVDAAFPQDFKQPADQLQRSTQWHSFVNLMCADSELNRFLCEFAPRVRDVVRSSPAFLKLLNLRDNMGGVRIERPRPDDPEALFFNSNMEVYNVHAGVHPLEVAQLLVHDLWHFKERDPIPFALDEEGQLKRDQSGKIITSSVEAQNRGMIKNEIDALMFSEVEFVEAVGIDAFEESIGMGTVAGLFREAGFHSMAEKHRAIEEMVRQGEIPKEVAAVIAKPDRFAWYREVIFGRLTGIHVRDIDNGIRTIHETWLTMPQVAAAALRMGGVAFDNHTSSDESYEQKRDRLLAQPVGVNPLLSAISHTRMHDAYAMGLKVAYLSELMAKQGLAESHPDRIAAARMQHLCEVAHADLSDLASQVTSTDCTRAHFDVYSQWRAIQGQLNSDVSDFVERVSTDAKLVGSDAVAVLKDRRHFPFALVPYAVPEQNRAKVQEILKRELSKHGFASMAVA